MKLNPNIFLFLILLIYYQGNSQNISEKKVVEEIEKLSKDESLKHASFAFCIKNLNADKILYQLNAYQSLVPASVMKIPTTSAALAITGNNFRYITALSYTGNINVNGELNGNLFIIGSGDPTFGTSRYGIQYSTDSIFSKWYKALKRLGIKKINGSVIADAEIFDDELIPKSWQWDDIGNYYGAGACGININENSYKVILKPGNNEGDNTSIVRYEPDIPYLNFVNKTVTAKEGTGDNVIIFGAPFVNTRTLSGSVPSGKNEFELKGSIPDPPYFCAYSFDRYLKNKNIQITELPNTVRNIKLQKKYMQQELTLIASHSSPVLDKIVYNTNTYSNNTFAEALIKTIGYFRNNEGSTISGARAVKDFWKSKKVDTEGLIMNDGSGLSPTNKINAMQIIQMLDYIYNDNNIKDNFYSSLPIAGVSGSIKDNFKNSAAENKLRAKSGYMNGVRAYAGYVRNKNGEMIAFSILINNYLGTPKELKDKLEKIMIAIAEMQ